MTERRDRHAHFEEQISASLSGDLSAPEQAELEGHLRDCALCRQTLSAFTEGRRMVGGLRHVAPPRDLQARVRGGIAASALPWWRRPIGIVAGVTGAAAVVAGALLALVVMNGDEPPVGRASPSPSSSVEASASADASTPEPASVATPAATPSEPPHPTPPAAIGYGAVNFLELTGTNQDPTLTLEGWDPATQTETDEPLLTIDGATGDPPVAIALSPDGHWLAYQAPRGLVGVNQITIVHLDTGETFDLGTTPDGSVFSQRMTWQSRSRYLAYTRGDPATETGPDAWVFDTGTQASTQLTDTGATYAASFEPGDAGESRLWVSVAGEAPVSHVLSWHDDAALPDRVDPDQASVESHNGVFQPILSPDGRRAIYWGGAMEQPDTGWDISSGGMLYLAEDREANGFSIADDPAIFPDLSIDQDAMTSTEVAWSFDSDWFAVSSVRWTGVAIEDAGGGAFPDERKLYIGQVSDGRLITAAEDSWHLSFMAPSDLELLDVAFIGPEGRDVPFIAVSILETSGGESGESPVATSRIVVAPAAPSDASGVEIGADAEWAGVPAYIPQYDSAP
jgi:hypothetical protein